MKDAILCDVDGTVALMMGKRRPFEYHKAMSDEPNHPVIATVLAMKEYYGCELIMLSAREDVKISDTQTCCELTAEWLNKHLGKDNWDETARLLCVTIW